MRSNVWFLTTKAARLMRNILVHRRHDNELYAKIGDTSYKILGLTPALVPVTSSYKNREQWLGLGGNNR